MRNFFVALWLLTTTALASPRHGSPSHSSLKPNKWVPSSTSGTDKLAWQGLQKLKSYDQSKHTNSTCTLETAYRRKEWDSLKPKEKKDYIKAVRCLQTTPSKSNKSMVPGARTRYDDFVAVHINQTLSIHSTGNFLTWHRYYVYIYEKALREECDYKGYQPYVNWGRYTNGIIGAPLFDGSDTSISDNGAYVPHENIYFLGPTANGSIITLFPSQGGGCIQRGPFKDYKTNLGPVSLVGINTTAPNPRTDGFGYNPRCLKRDLSKQAATGASDCNSTKLIQNNNDIASFQIEMEGPFIDGTPEIGVHASGHYMIAGDPGGDFFTSPGDPWFWLHHGQIDRTYWIWQNLGLPERLEAIAGTITFLNLPPSRNTTLDDRFDLGVNDDYQGLTIREAMSTMAGPFCYIYE